MNYYWKINQKPTFIFDKQARNSKNESKVVDTLWRIQVRDSLDQNIYLQWNIFEWLRIEWIYYLELIY